MMGDDLPFGTALCFHPEKMGTTVAQMTFSLLSNEKLA